MFESSDAVWVGIRIGDDGEELSPRQLIGSVPYAIHATSADEARSASHAGTADVAASLEGFNPSDYAAVASLSAVATTGAFADLTDVPVGLSDGDDDTLGVLICADSQLAVFDAGVGGWVCGEGLFTDLEGVPEGLLDGDDDTLAWLDCGVDQVPVFDGSAWVCGEASSLSAEEATDIVSRLEDLESVTERTGEEGILYGSYYVTNSSELDEIRGYTEITGNLFINNFDVPDLSALSSLTTIGDQLEISNLDQLTDLSGLENLTSVNRLIISENDNLEDVTALASLESIHTLRIQSDPALLEVALPSLEEIHEMDISSNHVLTSISFPILASGAAIEIGGNYDLVLLSIPALLSLSDHLHVGGSLESLMDVDMTSLTTIDAELKILETGLVDLSGFSSLTEVGGNVDITDKESLCQSLIDTFVDGISVGGAADVARGNDDGC